ncbi:hypothetical protein Gbem_1938 [Citrifermentans bemidjiense Bem]|uniref:Uncharacterized protein n=1 Tax=Citrifermentans bemidjiense (strain ATCC BAA-1014 / DSM 16622 / JCM 12645 / Bem) TaxID=404380 RepID=B5EBS8_CITBB|nr:hypothetical protein Gbem_1938 [Citrifermentans bemidjiense Bem]
MTEKPLFKLVSWFILASVFAVLCNGVCSTAHALESQISNSQDSAVTGTADSVDTPCCPDDHHDSDGPACDDCVNCLCHVTVVPQLFSLNYLPVFSDLSSFTAFRFIPEVYLPKFIPPQNLA